MGKQGLKPEPITDPMDQFVVDARVVADKRSTWIKRVSILFAVGLVVYLLVLSYNQSAENNRELGRVRSENQVFIQTQGELVRLITELRTSLESGQIEERQLRELIEKQNLLLEEAGLDTLDIPPDRDPMASPRSPESADRDAPPDAPTAGAPGASQSPQSTPTISDPLCKLVNICEGEPRVAQRQSVNSGPPARQGASVRPSGKGVPSPKASDRAQQRKLHRGSSGKGNSQSGR